MDPPQARLSINDLPPAVLARIFTLTDPDDDGLALLLTCRYWLGVVEAECPQHLWGLVAVDGEDERLVEQQSQSALLAGLRRQAACLEELHLNCTDVKQEQGAALTPLWPVLLRTAAAASGLSFVQIRTAVASPEHFASICEALGALTSLKNLSVHICAGRVPLPALHHLSTLARLEGLVVRRTSSTGNLPPALLPALSHLTYLGLELGRKQRIAWQHPDGSGPMLRHLRLSCRHIALPPGRLLPALWQLERLALYSVVLEEAQSNVLPQLPHLAYLSMEGMRVPWPAVLRCARLRELEVQDTKNRPPPHLPPGTLQQLSKLELPCTRALHGWLALPQLRHLKLGLWRLRSKLPPSLSQCLQLEDLWVAGPSLKEVTQAASSLTRLTSLTVFNEPSQEPQDLQDGPYLAGFRKLQHSTIEASAALHPLHDSTTWCLPAFLTAATSLEVLNLYNNSSLWLRGAEDAALLRTLPRLRLAILPLHPASVEESAAVVERIREGLREGAAVGAGPSHAVVVEGLELED